MLAQVLLGMLCSGLGGLAAWQSLPRPKQLPPIVIRETVTEERIVYVGLSVVPRGPAGLAARKAHTDRIAATLAVSTVAGRAAETPGLPRPKPAFKTIPAADDGCKPGRARNARGLCGIWKAG